MACKKWIDTRLFGQVFQTGKLKGDYADVVSFPVRGPATVSQAVSLAPITIEDHSCINTQGMMDPAEGKKKSAVFFRQKIVRKSAYMFWGGVSPQLASITGVTDDDVEALKDAILSMYDHASSAARPDGTIYLDRLLWWEMEGHASPAKIVRAVHLEPSDEYPYYKLTVDPVEGARMEEYR